MNLQKYTGKRIVFNGGVYKVVSVQVYHESSRTLYRVRVLSGMDDAPCDTRNEMTALISFPSAQALAAAREEYLKRLRAPALPPAQ